MQEILVLAQIAISLSILLYSSWRDYKTREVSNRVWAIYAPIALVLSLGQFLLFEPSKLPLFGLSAGLTIAFALLLFYSGGFGGADSKALICIALSMPFFPTILLKPLLYEGLSPLSQIVFPVTILSNSVLIAALSALCLLFLNIGNRMKNGKALFEGSLAKESIGKRILVLVTGKKFLISELKAKWHIYPLEDITSEETNEISLKRKIVIIPKDEGRDEIVARLSKAADEGKIDARVWATPGLPMLIFVTIGLVVAFSLGDIVWILISHIF